MLEDVNPILKYYHFINDVWIDYKASLFTFLRRKFNYVEEKIEEKKKCVKVKRKKKKELEEREKG